MVLVFIGCCICRGWSIQNMNAIVETGHCIHGLLYSMGGYAPEFMVLHIYLYQTNLLLIRMFSLHSPPVPMSVKVTHTYCSCLVLTGSCFFLDFNFDICLCSVVADPLNKSPELLEFFSQVASKARVKLVSKTCPQHNARPALNVIPKNWKHHNPMLCYSKVFITWKNKEKPAKFTWTTIIEVLKSPLPFGIREQASWRYCTMVDPVMCGNNWDLVQHILYLQVYDSLHVVCLMKISNLSKQVCIQDCTPSWSLSLCESLPTRRGWRIAWPWEIS